MKLRLSRQQLSELPGDAFTVDAAEDRDPVDALESYGVETLNAGPPDKGPSEEQAALMYKTLPFERIAIPEGGSEVVKWTFFLNSVCGTPMLTKGMANEFSLLADQIEPDDYVEIWGPSFMDEFFAVGVWSIIRSKVLASSHPDRIRVHAPYILNTGAALFLTFPCIKTVSPYMYCRITTPTVFAVGSHLDSMSGATQQVGLFQRIYDLFLSRGLITEKEYDLLMDNQTAISIYGDELARRLNASQLSK